MEMEELDDAYSHIEAASPEQLRAALTSLAHDPQALSPLLMLAAPEQQSQALQVQPPLPVPAWDAPRRAAALRRRRYVVLAAAALVAGIVLGSLVAGRACEIRPEENPALTPPQGTSPVFGPQPTPSPAGSTSQAATATAVTTRAPNLAPPVLTATPSPVAATPVAATPAVAPPAAPGAGEGK